MQIFQDFLQIIPHVEQGAPGLFRAGVDRKLVKECTGHSSDAVDKYQITSEEQREKLCEIIRSNPNVQKAKESNIDKTEADIVVSQGSVSAVKSKVDIGKVGDIVTNVIENVKKDRQNND